MKLHELKRKYPQKTRKRSGRGISAGRGMTAGRGTKGQKSRSGYNIPRKFEGGQMPLTMRLPKLPGFKSKKSKVVEVTFNIINKYYKNGEVISMQTLAEKGIIKKNERAKVLNKGKLKVKVGTDNISATKSASAILAAGGKNVSPTIKAKIKKTNK